MATIKPDDSDLLIRFLQQLIDPVEESWNNLSKMDYEKWQQNFSEIQAEIAKHDKIDELRLMRRAGCWIFDANPKLRSEVFDLFDALKARAKQLEPDKEFP